MAARPKSATSTRKSEAPSFNQDGQALGSKGRNTRARLLNAMESLLQTRMLHDISVADIARKANTSPPTFYLYFNDAADAALTVMNEHTQSTPALLDMVAEPWPGDGYEQAVRFVNAYIETWNSQGAVFRARNLAAEAGQPGFHAAREVAIRPLMAALTVRLKKGQKAGRLPGGQEPMAMAGVLIALLERVSVVIDTAAQTGNLSRQALIAATAYLVAQALHD
jgi:AcrR family transcriptional regulator